MCFPSGSSGPSREQRQAQQRSEFEQRLQAVQARREEAERQARINAGMQAADQIFGQYGLSPVADSIDPVTFKPMLNDADRAAFEFYFGGGLDNAQQQAAEANQGVPQWDGRFNPSDYEGMSYIQARDAAQQAFQQQNGARVSPGDFAPDGVTDRFGGGYDPSGFDASLLSPLEQIDPSSYLPEGFDPGVTPDFLDNRRQAFLDYANPELQEQYRDQQRQLLYALAGTGNLQSSIAAQRNQALQEQRAKAQQQIQNRARDVRDQTEDQLISARDALVTALQAGENPNVATRQAIQGVQQVSQAPSFQPIGELFAGATQGLAGYQLGKTRREVLGPDTSGLFARPLTGRGSSRIVGG